MTASNGWQFHPKMKSARVGGRVGGKPLPGVLNRECVHIFYKAFSRVTHTAAGRFKKRPLVLLSFLSHKFLQTGEIKFKCLIYYIRQFLHFFLCLTLLLTLCVYFPFLLVEWRLRGCVTYARFKLSKSKATI